ncbi:MAG TPA: Wzz/FepE/Etk N-terminal domain-containing protein, partial [Enterovirga sp.]|nr:Wzz/FepE/Etk N-terminal domain-containing protein [Enterovirga sp.]
MAQSFAAPFPASKQAAQPPVSEVNLSDIGSAVRRRWRWVALPTAVAFAGSLLFVNVVSPRYTGEAKLLLQSADTSLTRSAPERAEQQQIDEQAVASQVQVVMSRDLAREAIRRLNLVGNPEFDPAVRGIGTLHRIGALLGLVTNPLDRPPEDRVLDAYYDHLVVYTVGKSRIVSVEFRSKDAELASRAANTIAELYLSLQEDVKKDNVRV